LRTTDIGTFKEGKYNDIFVYYQGKRELNIAFVYNENIIFFFSILQYVFTFTCYTQLGKVYQ